jgi:16S rRNA (cytosine1402-N4)-methyltransferase
MHLPVLQKEVLEYLNPKPNENFIDATFGGGGHSKAILERIKPKGKLLAIEIDPVLYKENKKRIPKGILLVNDSYINLEKIVEGKKFKNVAGILFDLGLSSWHLEESGRGFSFKKKEPLDMRYSPLIQKTAEKIINYSSKFEIERILKEYGEEKRAGKITQLIIDHRRFSPIKTTKQLVEITNGPQRTFQALRIAVNDELNNLKKALPQALKVLKLDGRLVVISFHSLEDRIVKNFFKEFFQKGHLKILTKKPVQPSKEEIIVNPRSRSAKLRAGVKITK